MRELDVKQIEDKIAELCIEANHYLGMDVKNTISDKLEEEPWPVAQEILKSIQENI